MSVQSPGPAVAFDGVTKAYAGGTIAVDGVSVETFTGEGITVPAERLAAPATPSKV